MRVGLVSDTHGLFEPRLVELFAGCDLVLHAGDVVKASILDDLARIAPVRAVRGNNDLGPAFEHLPEIAHVELGEVDAVLVHQIGGRSRLLPAVRRSLARHRARVVVYGHSHRPGAWLDDGLLFVNPGSAGPRRFSLPRAAGLLDVRGRRVEVRLLDVASPRLPLLFPPTVADL
ncbi:MAG TPA: metallophosphoesterase family protein [Anaeromyxobacteraceae bacterium]